MRIPFNRPNMTGEEFQFMSEAHLRGQIAGDGFFTAQCSEYLKQLTGAAGALLTTSASSALDMSAILLDLKPGDEVILPSFTFVSTANAFALRGAIPVFVDIRVDTLNIDETLIEEAITDRTRAIVPVHYAGVACEMDNILSLAEANSLAVVEDAAQAIYSRYKGRPLGALGSFGCYSFHETKNITSGEGGVLLVGEDKDVDRAEVVREKGTNRSRFFRGQVDRYTWVDLGSSFLPGELTMAFLWAQLLHGEETTKSRLRIWDLYYEAFEALENEGLVRRPVVPPDCEHNAHMFYLLLPNLEVRSEFIDFMHSKEIGTVFHYVPLHSAPAGLRLGRSVGSMSVTESISERIVRLPMWAGIEPFVDEIIEAVFLYFRGTK